MVRNQAGLREIKDINWEEKVLNREEWKEVSGAAKTLKKLLRQRRSTI